MIPAGPNRDSVYGGLNLSVSKLIELISALNSSSLGT